MPQRPTSPLKAGERALRDVRTALADLPVLPTRREHDEMTERLKNVQAALTAKVQELRELTEWQRWANLGVQEQLCAKMEALNSLEDPLEIARQVHALQEQWRVAGDVPRPQGDVLWRRFRAAHDVVWARCAAYFAAEAEARAGNLARKLALCEKAEALAESTNWIPTAEEIKRLQLEWVDRRVTRGQERPGALPHCLRSFLHAPAGDRRTQERWAANIIGKALRAQVETLADRLTRTASEIEKRNEWKAMVGTKEPIGRYSVTAVVSANHVRSAREIRAEASVPSQSRLPSWSPAWPGATGCESRRGSRRRNTRVRHQPDTARF